MEPVFPAFLLCKLTSKFVRKSFHIIVFTHRIVFAAENKSLVRPFFDRMVRHIVIIWEIEGLNIVIY